MTEYRFDDRSLDHASDNTRQDADPERHRLVSAIKTYVPSFNETGLSIDSLRAALLFAAKPRRDAAEPQTARDDSADDPVHRAYVDGQRAVEDLSYMGPGKPSMTNDMDMLARRVRHGYATDAEKALLAIKREPHPELGHARADDGEGEGDELDRKQRESMNAAHNLNRAFHEADR